MNGKLKKILIAVACILAAALYYYIVLPPINIHSMGFWFFLMLVSLGVLVGYIIKKEYGFFEIKKSLPVKIMAGFFVLIVLIFLVGAILSTPIVNAKKYQQLLTVEQGEFAKDIEELSYDQIPLLDKESAKLLGNRKMGSMVDMVSQFEIDDIYSQINYNDKPVRVSPLRYANEIKWLTNRKDGIPAYVKIDMATQTTELVKLEKGIKYSPFEHFSRNINRHLRFKYPTYIFGELSFEVDEEGTPYWVCPVKQYNIGLFGGETVGRVVLCNAISGKTTEYAVEDVPQWVDRVYSADLLVSLYDYHGTLKHGFINSVLGQKDCLTTTDGYNYLAIDDDVWVYTGVTSITGDQSNVGFVLMNQRTMETKFYKIEGATEKSAMESAEGQVQNLNYQATFPLLLNIGGEPTYFIALKDNAGLVKKYAMVNIQKYQLVAIGNTVNECEEEYQKLLVKEGIKDKDKTETEEKKENLVITGTIAKMVQSVIDGDSHYYIVLEGSEEIFDIKVSEMVQIIRYEVGQEITMEYEKNKQVNKVLLIK